METTPLVMPFVGERFAETDSLSRLISPPYDVISEGFRQELIERHDRNIVRLILPEGGEDRYAEAAKLVAAWRADGTLVSESGPGVYVLQQTFTTPAGNEFTRTGMMAALAAEPYEGGRVRPHEKTHKGPKVDRLALMQSTETMFEALLMLAPDDNGALLQALLKVTEADPIARATLDGVELALWFMSGEEGQTAADLASRGDIYIADGHHRFETAVAYREENSAATHTLAMIVPQSDPGLVVLPTHRVLTGQKMTIADLGKLLDPSWEIEALPLGADPEKAAGEIEVGCIVLCDDGAVTCRERKDITLARVGINLDERVQSLNIARVDAMVVEPIKRATNAVLTYSADAAEVVGFLADTATVGVLVPATPVSDVIGVADAKGFMPQKSTYFLPKAPSGLVTMPVGK